MNTHSLCPECYRHIPATLEELNGTISLTRNCPEHGSAQIVVENDAHFYHAVRANGNTFNEPQNMIVLDVTDRCNLSCAHCYQVPDNTAENKSVALVLQEIQPLPGNMSIILGGAEPTMRKDLAQIIGQIRSGGRAVGMLSNGVRFADGSFTAQVAPYMNGMTLIGLNHKRYHPEGTHRKQLEGIYNLNEHGVRPMLGYTAEYAELADILTEALTLHAEGRISMVRLRFGASIGRHPDAPYKTLSDHVKQVENTCQQLHLNCERLLNADNTLYHQMLLIGKMPVRIIQWPDEHNMVMTELGRAPWAKFIAGPVSNFCHQIVLRDGLLHKKLPQLDTVPQVYTLQGFLNQTLSARQPALPADNLANAHYLKKIGALTIANLHGKMTEAQKDAIIAFWLENGAIPNEQEARRRTAEVVHLVFDETGRILAVNTCYAAQLDSPAASGAYWFYRQFVHPEVRSIRLSLALVRLSAGYFSASYRQQGGAQGIAMYLENPKLYKKSGRRVFEWLKMKQVSRDDQGAEIWTLAF